MTEKEILKIVGTQKDFFRLGKTLDVSFRITHLKKLYDVIKKKEDEIERALYKDLSKSKSEAYMCEIGLVLSEISYMLKHIKNWTKPRKKRSPLAQFRAVSFTITEPYGTVLVMSPWNYPFLLSLDPLVEAIAAGNTVIIKTSEYSPYTNEIVKEITEDVFDLKYATVIFGGIIENQTLIHAPVDYIFFTGSKKVGRIVYEAASKMGIPVTLELGGKSPCIVDRSAKIELTAKRIIFGKLLNLGQTCVAPDYILVKREVHDKLIEALKKEIIKQYGSNYLESSNYGKIIDYEHFKRVISLLDEQKLIYGGGYNEKLLKIEPTILDNVSYSDKVMQEEIFGPILPVIVYDDISEVIDYVNSHDAPLACYIFARNKKLINYLIRQIGFGGGCINDTLIHLSSSYLGFGGFKESGLGSYHGKAGFYTFSHTKSIIDKKLWIDLPMRYSPYSKEKDRIIHKFLK